MSDKAYNSKMYHLSKAVFLPEGLDMPKTMYELKPTYNLPSDVGESYYRSLDCQTSSLPSSGCSNGKVACNTDDFSNSIQKLEANQKVVLEKLQHFKGRLESLLGNNFKSIDLKNLSNNRVSADVANGNEIVGVIDSLKNHLLSKTLENENRTSFCDFDASEKWYKSLLDQLKIFHEETDNIAFKSENIKFLSHEDDLHQRQEAILNVIDALELLMKSQISSNSSCLEDPMKFSIGSYHRHVLNLVEALQNELCKISKKCIFKPIQLSAFCSCNLSETDLIFKANENSTQSQLVVAPVSIESEISFKNEFFGKSGCIHDIVISANPLNPPYSVIVIKNILAKSGLPVLLTSKIHSSLDQVPIDPKVSRLFQEENNNERGTYDVAFTVLWKKQEIKSLMVSPISHSEIYGEANILRYISRILPFTSTLKYEIRENLAEVSQTDYWLDSIQSKLLQGSNKERLSFVKQLNARLGTSQWIVCTSFGLADVFAWSVILQLNIKENLPNNAAKWFNATSKYCGLFSD